MLDNPLSPHRTQAGAQTNQTGGRYMYMYSVWWGSALPLISQQLMISRLTHFQHDPEGTVWYGLPLLDNPKCKGAGCLRVVYLQCRTVGIEWLVVKIWCWCLGIRECLPPKLSKDCWLVAIWLLLFQSERAASLSSSFSSSPSGNLSLSSSSSR